MELTILNLVLLTFVAGVVGGLVIAEQMDLDQTAKRRKRMQRREAKRQARRAQATRRMEKMRNIYVDTNWKI